MLASSRYQTLSIVPICCCNLHAQVLLHHAGQFEQLIFTANCEIKLHAEVLFIMRSVCITNCVSEMAMWHSILPCISLVHVLPSRLTQV